MNKRKCYIAGQVSGTGDYRERFAQAEQEVVQMGMIPVNPVTLPHNHDGSWESAMKEAITAMMGCEAIYLLRDWYKSTGAEIERKLARGLNYEIIFQNQITNEFKDN